MEKRIQIDVLEPEAYKGMYTLENFIATCSLKTSHIHLIKLRASLINGCAFCIDMHTKQALQDGEDQKRLFLISAWKETDLFTPEEQLLFRLTEEVTLIHRGGLSSGLYNEAIEMFGSNSLAQILLVIATINAWNRIAISTRKPLLS